MSEIRIAVVPKLRTSTAKAAQFLSTKRPRDVLFLDFPRSAQECIVALAEGYPREEILKELRSKNLVPEPFAAWESLTDPLLEVLPKVREKQPDLEICCYSDVRHSFLSADVARAMSQLTLRAVISSDASTKEWRRLLHLLAESGEEAREDEVEFIAQKAQGHSQSLCLSGTQGYGYCEQLANRGFAADLECLDHYKPLPLDILRERYEKIGEAVSDEEIISLVKMHVEFIRNYVLRSVDVDEAYSKWHRVRGQDSSA